MNRRSFLRAVLAAPAVAAAVPMRTLLAPPLRVAIPERFLYARVTFEGIPWVADPYLPPGVFMLQAVRNELESLAYDIRTRTLLVDLPKLDGRLEALPCCD
jgi:hypothetical protein